MTIARDKITEIFCMADDFCHIYDRFIKINGLAPSGTSLKGSTTVTARCPMPR